MKIAGFTHYEGQYRLVMKSDSSLLNQGKPFFLPAWSNEVVMQHCYVVRICRLGRFIEPRYASRYYDAVTEGIDFIAADLWHSGAVTEAMAFDGSLCVGEWQTPAQWTQLQEEESVPEGTLAIADAIAQISRIMTLRMGDLLFIDYAIKAQSLQRDQIIRYPDNEQPLLYCKIK